MVIRVRVNLIERYLPRFFIVGYNEAKRIEIRHPRGVGADVVKRGPVIVL
ncbi:hypothetical protein [Nitrosomonas sp.]|nr:hypothetical protein [Nitrosomonas sp.]